MSKAQPQRLAVHSFESTQLKVAQQLDQADELASFREKFHIPKGEKGRDVHYFCGNSLGLQPKGARAVMEQELDDWRDLAVEAHFEGKTPWYSYHEVFEKTGATIVGAKPGEVVMMNTLTTNLHLMMVSFYQPTTTRRKVLVESTAFPSDNYAVKSQVQFHGGNPEEDILRLEVRDGESTIRTEDILDLLEQRGSEIALVMMGGVNYFTGQLFDMEAIAQAAQAQGCKVGFDLAHAAGNVPLRLHDWGVDFAVWCNYKYLNSGPGAIAGCFVHQRYAKNAELPRFAGWWGNDPKDRFQMHLLEEFVPHRIAEGWQLSNPSIFSMAPLQASLQLYEEAGMDRLRKKSVQLTAYLEFLLDAHSDRFEILTPRDPAQRGCQLSVRVVGGCSVSTDALKSKNCICDFRKPDVLRVAPTPLYNSYKDVWHLVQALLAMN